jgi:hypothetical protein
MQPPLVFRKNRFLYIIGLMLLPLLVHAQVEIKIDPLKSIALLRTELALEHPLKNNTSLHHQISTPGFFAVRDEVGKQFAFMYGLEYRIYPSIKTSNLLFLAPTARIGQYKDFRDYELGGLIGYKVANEYEKYSFEIKLGFTHSFNYLGEDLAFVGNTGKTNFIFNLMIGKIL